jgi:hypothetical protein
MNSNLKKMEIRSYSIKKSQHANKEPTKNSNLSFRQGLSQILRGQNFELFRKSKVASSNDNNLNMAFLVFCGRIIAQERKN